MILLILFHATNANCQHRQATIQIRILDSVATTNRGDQKIQLRIDCQNKSDSTFLLYGIDGGVRDIPVKAERLWNNREIMSAGCALYIYDSSMKKMGSKAPMVSKDIDYKPMTKEMLDSITTVSKTKYLKATKVIRGFESIRIKKEIDLKEYDLAKGNYYVQVVYFSGKSIASMVEPERILKDKKKSSSGCIPRVRDFK